jgi:hypothetical protein
LKWPLGADTHITAYNSAFIYTATKCGGFLLILPENIQIT